MSDMDPSLCLQQAKLVHSENAVNHAIDRLVSQITQDYQDAHPIVICVMTGGAYLVGHLLAKLKIPMQLDYVHATRYQNDVPNQQIQWIVKPRASLRGRQVLIVDDILDEGLTLAAIVESCLLEQPEAIKIAVLTEKELSAHKPVKADYVGLVVPNLYVFGCGMDIKGWWRNLPAIYALSE